MEKWSALNQMSDMVRCINRNESVVIINTESLSLLMSVLQFKQPCEWVVEPIFLASVSPAKAQTASQVGRW